MSFSEELQLELDSAYGDGWYDGFLEAQKIESSENQYDCIDNYSRDDVREMSEHAESNAPSYSRERWSKAIPTKQGLYWHWTGDKDSAPVVFSVLYSGTKKECFIASGQYGFRNAVFCSEYGGWWAKCYQPRLPEDM